MTDTKVQTPNAADFSCDEKPGEYTAKFEVRGIISIPIKAESQEDAQLQAEEQLYRIEKEGYVEIDNIEDVDLQRVTKDRPMYRVIREGQSMQVSRLLPGDLPRDPDPSYGF